MVPRTKGGFSAVGRETAWALRRRGKEISAEAGTSATGFAGEVRGGAEGLEAQSADGRTREKGREEERATAFLFAEPDEHKRACRKQKRNVKKVGSAGTYLVVAFLALPGRVSPTLSGVRPPAGPTVSCARGDVGRPAGPVKPVLLFGDAESKLQVTCFSKHALRWKRVATPLPLQVVNPS